LIFGVSDLGSIPQDLFSGNSLGHLPRLENATKEKKKEKKKKDLQPAFSQPFLFQRVAPGVLQPC
jgi:hypothetical protein